MIYRKIILNAGYQFCEANTTVCTPHCVNKDGVLVVSSNKMCTVQVPTLGKALFFDAHCMPKALHDACGAVLMNEKENGWKHGNYK
jgi:hypothetical protein